MTSRFSVGATMNSAPASRTARAVSASRTVPAPSSKRSPSACRTWRRTSNALGTVMVISTTETPPSARARATSTSCWLSGERTTATMPQSSTWRSCDSLLMGGSSEAGRSCHPPKLHSIGRLRFGENRSLRCVIATARHILLLLDQRLRFDDRVLFGKGVEGGEEEAAGAGFDRDEAERGQG